MPVVVAEAVPYLASLAALENEGCVAELMEPVGDFEGVAGRFEHERVAFEEMLARPPFELGGGMPVAGP